MAIGGLTTRALCPQTHKEFFFVMIFPVILHAATKLRFAAWVPPPHCYPPPTPLPLGRAPVIARTGACTDGPR